VIGLLRKISGWMSLVLVAFGCGDLLAADLVNAARVNNQVELRELLAGGANVDVRAQQGATALHWAAFNGNAELVHVLLKAGASVGATLENGSTPLHLAAFEGHTEVVRLLLRHGANASARNQDGITPIAWARSEQHQETLEALIAGGKPDGRKPKAAKKSLPSGSRAQASRGGSFRIQLVAVSSEERARQAINDYRQRFGDILQDLPLLAEPVDVAQRRLYRVQSGVLPKARAKALCDSLKERSQACVLRAAGSP